MTMTQRPNVIWIFGDQHRNQCLSFSGDPNVATPCLDRLAGEGLTMRGVSGYPLCCPYRGSLMTSRYPHHCVPGHEDPIPEDQQTIAHAFRGAGYHTAWIGKWHLAGWKERDGRAGLITIPRARRGGFDTFVGYENNNSQWDCHVHGHRAAQVGGAGEEVEHYRLRGYETDVLTGIFIEHLRHRAVIAARDGTPFFSALSVQPPHDPYVAPQEWMRRHTPAGATLRPNVPRGGRVEEQARREIAGYNAMVENLDWNIGRIRDALLEVGLADNTHILFFSDHGDMLGSQGQFRKTNPFAESIDVPMILGGMQLYGPVRGHAPALVNHVDIAPTTLGLCGINKPDWMVGYDYSHRRLRDRKPAGPEPDSAYLQLVRPTLHGDSIDRPWRGIVTVDGWKYVCFEKQPWVMFDLKDDPYEMANLAFNTRFRAQRKKLHDRLRAWVADTGDTFALPEV